MKRPDGAAMTDPPNIAIWWGWATPRQWSGPEEFVQNSISMQHTVEKPFEVYAREWAEQREAFWREQRGQKH